MKKNALIGLLFLTIIGSFAGSVSANTVVNGKATAIYTDPSDVVIALTTAGPCGSKFFHIKRSKANFNEFSRLVQEAFIAGKSLYFEVATCSGDRNILSHGAMY